jgi:large-conductance mechanosensitive channel
MVVKGINASKKKEEDKSDEEPVADPEDILLLREIRDSLKK